MMKSTATPYTLEDWYEEVFSIEIEEERDNAIFDAQMEEFYHMEEPIHPAVYEWLDNPANMDDINYSDIYKDVYGYRPRFTREEFVARQQRIKRCEAEWAKYYAEKAREHARHLAEWAEVVAAEAGWGGAKYYCKEWYWYWYEEPVYGYMS